ncbi:MAG: hypothetical protein EOP48_27365 [Sphingobacteriales bacterium]|nr:MAG: hypothetical protein EOP48_27365 [Sphingobacteriales bacterium]
MTPEVRNRKDKSIKEYLKSQGISKVIYLQPESKFKDLDEEIIVWNVKTNKGAWWVVEGDNTPMNLYTQDAFYFSADEAYSFHLGIVQRLREGDRLRFRHIIDELPLDLERIKSIKRKLSVAAQQLNSSVEAEHFQSIGLVCRECLIDLGKELIRRNDKVVDKGIKEGDFKNIANAFVDYYIPGSSNSDLRNYSRKLIDTAWGYSSQVVHSSTKNLPDAKIGILFVSTVVSLMENLFLKHLGYDHDLVCSDCQSRDYELSGSDETNDLHFVCNSCGSTKTLPVAQ